MNLMAVVEGVKCDEWQEKLDKLEAIKARVFAQARKTTLFEFQARGRVKQYEERAEFFRKKIAESRERINRKNIISLKI